MKRACGHADDTHTDGTPAGERTKAPGEPGAFDASRREVT